MPCLLTRASCTGAFENQSNCHRLQEDSHLSIFSDVLLADSHGLLSSAIHITQRAESKAKLGLGSPQRMLTSSGGCISGCGLQAEQRLIVFEHRQPGKLGAKRSLSYILLWLLSKWEYHYPLHMLSFGACFKNILKGMKIKKRGECVKKDYREEKNECVWRRVLTFQSTVENWLGKGVHHFDSVTPLMEIYSQTTPKFSSEEAHCLK